MKQTNPIVRLGDQLIKIGELSMSEQREIKYKNPLVVYLLWVCTFGIYGLVWIVKSKRDLVALGAEIPTSWLLLIPLANLYWNYKWIAGYCHVNQKGSPILLFLGSMIFFPIALALPYLIQSAINKHATRENNGSILDGDPKVA